MAREISYVTSSVTKRLTRTTAVRCSLIPTVPQPFSGGVRCGYLCGHLTGGCLSQLLILLGKSKCQIRCLRLSARDRLFLLRLFHGEIGRVNCVMREIEEFGENACHPSLRSGSGSSSGEILRCAQDDTPDSTPVRSRQVLSPNVCTKLSVRNNLHITYV